MRTLCAVALYFGIQISVQLIPAVMIPNVGLLMALVVVLCVLQDLVDVWEFIMSARRKN